MMTNNAPTNVASVKLDRDLYNATWNVYALRVPPRFCHSARKIVKPLLLHLLRVPAVIKHPVETNDSLLVLLRFFAERPSVNSAIRGNLVDAHVNSPADVAELIAACHSSCDPSSQSLLRSFISSITKDDIDVWPVTVTYSNCTIEHVLRTLLPAGLTVPTSFETIGHIAHMNLRSEHAPWKKVIGEILLEKLAPRITMIVNKTDSTGGPYRTFAMEVLAGKSNFITTVKENGCNFTMDFEKVYWNSRLETEHRRIVDSLEEGEVMADAFCGIGPFALPAAKLAVCAKVYANDLNPSSVHYMRENAEKNGIPANMLESSCGCARDFVSKLVSDKVAATTVVMNFPSGAPEFLDMFRGAYCKWPSDEVPEMPLIHCYFFLKGEMVRAAARERIRNGLFGDDGSEAREILPDSEISIRVVRDVAPRKLQLCASFRLPTKVAYAEYGREDTNEEHPKKRKRTCSPPINM